MNALQLIANDAFITTNKALIRQFGLIEANIIGLFASIAQYNNSQHPENDGWFYATYDRINEELGLSQYVAAKPIEKLIEAGILLDKKQGVPCRRFFKFNEEKLLNSLLSRNSTTGNKETQQLEIKKLNNKELKNSTASDAKTPLPAEEKLGRNNKPNKNTHKKPNLGQVFSGEKKVWLVEEVLSYLTQETKAKVSTLGKDLNWLLEKYVPWINRTGAPNDLNSAFPKWAENFTKKMTGGKKLSDPIAKATVIAALESGAGTIRTRLFHVMQYSLSDWKEHFEKAALKNTDAGWVIYISNSEIAEEYQELFNNVGVKIEIK